MWLPIIWLALVVFCGLAANLLPLTPPDQMDWDYLSLAPGAGELEGGNFWLGTDHVGRDILSRLVHGARVSLTVGVFSTLIGFVLGGALGMWAGYFRGRTDTVIVGVMDVILAFPGLVLLLAVSFFFEAGLTTLVPVLGFLVTPRFCRVARATTLKLAQMEFVLAAESLGETRLAIIMREILPNVVVSLSVYAFLIMGVMIVIEGIMSFLGLGVPPPTPSWGGMIADGREVLDEAPHIALIPAAVLFLTVLSLNLLGDTLRSWARQRGGAQ
jgi:peptide/nickel transport system permease protein